MLEKIVHLPISDEKLDLLTHYFSNVRVFVYGSCVNILPEEDKDVDLVVVSTDFAGVVGIKRRQLVCRLLEAPSLRIDPICLTPRDLERLCRSESMYALSLTEQMMEIVRTTEDV